MSAIRVSFFVSFFIKKFPPSIYDMLNFILFSLPACSSFSFFPPPSLLSSFSSLLFLLCKFGQLITCSPEATKTQLKSLKPPPNSKIAAKFSFGSLSRVKFDHDAGRFRSFVFAFFLLFSFYCRLFQLDNGQLNNTQSRPQRAHYYLPF